MITKETDWVEVNIFLKGGTSLTVDLVDFSTWVNGFGEMTKMIWVPARFAGARYLKSIKLEEIAAITSTPKSGIKDFAIDPDIDPPKGVSELEIVEQQ